MYDILESLLIRILQLINPPDDSFGVITGGTGKDINGYGELLQYVTPLRHRLWVTVNVQVALDSPLATAKVNS